MDELPGDLIPASEAAKLLQLNVCVFYRWCMEGRIRAARRGGRIFVRRSDVAHLFEPVASKLDDKAAQAAAKTDRKESERKATESHRRAMESLKRLGIA